MVHPPTRHAELDVLDVVEETRDARSIVLQVPPHLQAAFAYAPGQFLTVRIPGTRPGPVARSYSLSSAPGIDRNPTITVKRTDGGYGSNWLCDNVRAGDALTVLPPAGQFTPRDLDADLLLAAAGSGITPVISILKSALRAGTGSVRLFYANRDAGSVIFAEELRRLGEQHGARLTVRHWLDAERGVPDPARIGEMARAAPDGQAYLCGPAPFMDAAAAGLAAAGVVRERIHREVFVSLTGDPFAAVETAPAEPCDGPACDAVVHLAGETHTFAWPPGQTLVDALLAREVDVPYSCRSGECGSCTCRVVHGAVDMASADLLDQEDVDDGYVLGCQARPASDRVEIEF